MRGLLLLVGLRLLLLLETVVAHGNPAMTAANETTTEVNGITLNTNGTTDGNQPTTLTTLRKRTGRNKTTTPTTTTAKPALTVEEKEMFFLIAVGVGIVLFVGLLGLMGFLLGIRIKEGERFEDIFKQQ